MNDEELEPQCVYSHCSGVVKEYSEDGPREPPEQAKPNSVIRELRLALYYLGIPVSPPLVTWHECSVCHEYQPRYNQ